MQVRVLFRKELDKVYDPNEPVDDMREREEEMERMREHVFKGKTHGSNYTGRPMCIWTIFEKLVWHPN